MQQTDHRRDVPFHESKKRIDKKTRKERKPERQRERERRKSLWTGQI